MNDASKIEYDICGIMKWQRVVPALFWPAANAMIVADRHLPCGTRQHMVQGKVPYGAVIDGAQVIGEDDSTSVEFSRELSHLSLQKEGIK